MLSHQRHFRNDKVRCEFQRQRGRREPQRADPAHGTVAADICLQLKEPDGGRGDGLKTPQQGVDTPGESACSVSDRHVTVGCFANFVPRTSRIPWKDF